jgi:hypothetical protein
MKKVIVIVLLAIGSVSTAWSQTTSLDNNIGNWEDGASWQGGIAPPGDILLLHLNLTINGYITRTGNINVGFSTDTRDFIVNDTLVILGDLNMAQNSARLVIGPNAVLIVIGNFTSGNNHKIINNGIFVVSGEMTFPNNDSEVYDDSGGGELFVGGDAENNTDARDADRWDELDDFYPDIYDFVVCRSADPGASCMLPIKLSYFVAELQNDIVELRWATIMEENFQKFVVQRASNGIDFEDIGEVAGKGFDIYNIESKYSFEDRTPLTGFNYYRLKAVDLDESFEYFGVKAVKVSAQKKMAVYPNPSTGDFISFSVNFNPGESDRIVLVDQLGVEVFSGQAIVAESSIRFKNKLRSGVYILRYIANGFEQTTRILVRN